MNADSRHVAPAQRQLLHDFFLSWVSRTPDALALDIPAGSGDRRQATYTELAGAAYGIRRQLQHRVSGEVLVALLFPRTSIEAYASQLAVLLSGAAYVSLDPALPDARLADVVDDAGPVALLTDAAGARRAAALGLASDHVLVVDGDTGPTGGTALPAPVWLSASTLAYVIYTSGTTGRPKGVMIEHRAIVNLVASDLDAFGIRPGDRVAQTSSHGYDSSVEEIWLALASGATLVVPDDWTVRAGPDVLAWLVRERITVWCPSPTLLRATGCRHAADVPASLRLVYVGGEAMPADVVEVWADGRRLVNGYGPTECAVVATRADMAPGRPVSIGWPITGNEAWVIVGEGDERRAAKPGETGELCLGGAGLARGYWRAPDITADRFVMDRRFGRMYRTGDLATRTAEGELFCLGRRDSQVKIRGHRVELEDIEAHLGRAPGVRAAACVVTGSSLAALVVPVDGSAPPSPQEITAALARELPSHMVPARVLITNTLPMTSGGKLDRSGLGALIDRAAVPGAAAALDETASALETLIADAVAGVLGRHVTVTLDAHIFEMLGADSLAAAEIVTALRTQDDTAAVTVRDLYTAPTVRALATRLELSGRRRGSQTAQHSAAVLASPLKTTVFQALWLATTLVLNSALAAGLIVVLGPPLVAALGLVQFLLALPLLAAAVKALYSAAAIAVGLSAKRLLIGRYTVGREAVWGSFYLRNWLVERAVAHMPWKLAEGTLLQTWMLRALGARIGERVHLHKGVDLTRGGWDLLSIGDDVTLNQEAAIRLIDVEAGAMVIGPVTIEAGSTIDVRAGVAPGTHMGRGTTLTALSSLAAGSRIPDGERWTGVPAEPDGRSEAQPAATRGTRALSPTSLSLRLLAARVFVGSLTIGPAVGVAVALALSSGADAAAVLAWLEAPTWSREAVLTIVTLTFLPLPVTLALQAGAVRALGPVAPGVIDVMSSEYVRVWTKTLLVNDAGPWLSGALAWRTWLRTSGMQVGHDAEVSTIIDVVPDQVTIGAGTFLTDGVYLGSPRVHRGRVTMAHTTLGQRVFVGNHAVVPCGQRVPDGVLVGVCTVAGGEQIAPGSAWFGLPAFPLARRPDEMDRDAFRPSPARYVARVFFESARFALPALPVVAAVLWYSMLRGAWTQAAPLPFFAVAAPLASLAAGSALCAMVLALKWMLLGRVRPGRHDFWSCWCFRWDLVYVAWQQLARPILAALEGTLLLTWYLRAMGARIGRRVVLGRGFAQVVDPDMLRFDDDTTVRGLLQAHTFEGRVLKIDRVRVRRGASIGSNALLFYGADVGEHTRVAAHSVVMKRERLPAGRSYEGCPTRLSAADATAT